MDSDSDESVDVPDSSDDECSQTQSAVSNRILHKQQYVLPNQGVANRNSKQINTSVIMKNLTKHATVPEQHIEPKSRLHRQRPSNHRYVSEYYEEDDDVVKMGAPVDYILVRESKLIPIDEFITNIVNSSPNHQDNQRFTVHHEDLNN